MTTANWVRFPVPIPPRKMSYEEFLEWADEDLHAEWVDGSVEYTHLAVDPETLEITMSVSKAHTLIGKFLIAVLQMWLETAQMGELFYAPYQMKTGPDLPGREPDVMIVSNDRLDLAHEKHLEGPADVVFEIVSDESVTRDRIWKLAEYERGGVREYWIIDPLKSEVLLYFLSPIGDFEKAAPGDGGVLHSRVLTGVWFDPEWFWQAKLPSASDVLRQWGVLA